MANPFYVQPASFEAGFQGLFEGIQTRADLEKAKAKLAKRQVIRDEAAELLKAGDPESIAKMAVQHEWLAEDLMKSAHYLNDATKQNAIDSAKRVLLNNEVPSQVLIDRAKFVLDQGGDATHTMQLAEEAQINPINAVKQAEVTLALNDPKAYEQYKKAMKSTEGIIEKLTPTQKEYNQAKREGYKGTFIEFKQALSGKPADTLTATQKDYKLAKEEGFKGDFVGYKQAVSGVGPKTELEMQKLKVQITDLEERRQARLDNVVAKQKMADKKTRVLVSGIDSVLEEVGKAVTEAKASPSATGITGAATAIIPGSPAYNLRRRVDTIKANIGFDKLQAMRDASPTGGALGQVSERELGYLQSTITALDPNMGDNELIAALGKVKLHYDNWKKTLQGELPKDGSDGDGDGDGDSDGIDEDVSKLSTERLLKIAGGL